ncbi:MAG: DUF4783 domain-containing protein [Paludibacter sp.]|nr:DUF4783 domain-containing protein [Paludibacter sp.]
MKNTNIAKKNNAMPIIHVVILFLICSQIAVSQNNTQSIPDEIISALNRGDCERLASKFDKSISLTVNTQTGVYSAVEAKKILTDFFIINAVENFKIVHQGGSEQSCFVIGTLKTANGSFRIYLLMRGKPLVIQQILIGKEQRESL